MQILTPKLHYETLTLYHIELCWYNLRPSPIFHGLHSSQNPLIMSFQITNTNHTTELIWEANQHLVNNMMQKSYLPSIEP